MLVSAQGISDNKMNVTLLTRRTMKKKTNRHKWLVLVELRKGKIEFSMET